VALSPDQIRELIGFGREQAGVEFKSAGDLSEPHLRAKVVRGMLAMGNRRDGGLLIVGIRDDGTTLYLDGLTPSQASSWAHDTLADTVAEYADPRLGFDSYRVTVDGHEVLVISVAEFTDVPVVCRRTLTVGKSAILRDGAVYLRSNRKPESREVANYDEMRELIELATDKGVRRFVTRARESGLEAAERGVDADAAYRAERGDL